MNNFVLLTNIGIVLLISLTLFSLIITILVVVSKMLFVIVTVKMSSMEPVLREGNRVLAIRHWPAEWLRKGDIVLVWPCMDDRKASKELKPFDVIPYIKRVVGLPGDILAFPTDQSNLHYFDFRKRPYIREENGARIWMVPAGHFFVRGDNPIGNIDSYNWGPIPNKSLLGIVVLKFRRG